MTIEFHCPSCQKQLRTADSKAGKRAKCPDCGTPVTVPAAEVDEEYGLGGGASGDFDYDDDDYDQPESQRSRSVGRGASSGGSSKKCPMCGEKIKSAAVRCRYCGEDVEDEGDDAAPRRRRRRRRGRRQLNYAGFWMRFCAAFIDSLLLGAINVALKLMMGLPLVQNPRMRQPPGDAGKELLVSLIAFVIGWLYGAFMESSENQGTLGKMALGIVVTDEHGDRIGFGRATGRHFGKIISTVICLAGYIMAGMTEKKQALHDMMAGCLVIRR